MNLIHKWLTSSSWDRVGRSSAGNHISIHSWCVTVNIFSLSIRWTFSIHSFTSPYNHFRNQRIIMIATGYFYSSLTKENISLSLSVCISGFALQISLCSTKSYWSRFFLVFFCGFSPLLPPFPHRRQRSSSLKLFSATWNGTHSQV